MEEIVYIGLGSNLGDRVAHLKNALSRLDEHPECKVLQVSPFYETEPWGEDVGGWFVNAAAAVRTGLSPLAFMALLLQLEEAAGRTRSASPGPRSLDLDLLFFGSQVIRMPNLTAPHPRLHERRFVLLPLSGDPDTITERRVMALWFSPL